MPIRVVLVDDQPLVLTGLRRILGAADGLDVVGEFRDGAELVGRWRPLRPDVVVMDVRMPRMDGATATARLRREPDAPPILILTTFGEDDVLSAALRAGAAGFLLKDALGEEIIRATRRVALGDAYLDPAVTGRVLAAYRGDAPLSASDSSAEPLTTRELEVLRLMARGSSNEEIAGALFISEATVKTHIAHIFGKTAVRDRAGAIVYAFDRGLVRPGG